MTASSSQSIQRLRSDEKLSAPSIIRRAVRRLVSLAYRIPQWILPSLMRLARHTGTVFSSYRSTGQPRAANSRAAQVPVAPAPRMATFTWLGAGVAPANRTGGADADR